ncbi:MAG: hypothetical protein WEB63_03160 [Cucumibacter sp.]
MRGLQVVAAATLGAGLAACASLSLPTANALRALDFFNDDMAALLLALDLPSSVAPVPFGAIVTILATTPAHGERLIEAALTPADGESVVGTLPPPGRDRAYYVFGFSDADKEKLREAQQWGRGLPGGFAAAGGALGIDIDPQLCALTGLDPQTTTFSVLVALPGGDGLAPLVSNAKLADLLARSGDTELPACGEDG